MHCHEINLQKGPFVVVRVEVTDIDKMAVVNAAKGAEFAAHFSSLLSAVTDLGLAESVIPSIDDKVISKIFKTVICYPITLGLHT